MRMRGLEIDDHSKSVGACKPVMGVWCSRHPATTNKINLSVIGERTGRDVYRRWPNVIPILCAFVQIEVVNNFANQAVIAIENRGGERAQIAIGGTGLGLALSRKLARMMGGVRLLLARVRTGRESRRSS